MLGAWRTANTLELARMKPSPHPDIEVVCSCWQKCLLRWEKRFVSLSGAPGGRYVATKPGWVFNAKAGQWTCGMAGHKQLK